MEKTKLLMDKRNNWFTKRHVVFQLLEGMRQREVMFLDLLDYRKVKRGFFITHDQFFKKLYYHYNLFDELFNIYISVAKYEEIPFFNLDLRKRKEETQLWFLGIAKSKIIGYDMLLDFDCKDRVKFPDMLNEVREFSHVLLNNDICFQIYPSGQNFQIVIPSECFNFPKDIEMWEYIKKLTNKIKYMFQLEYLDTKGIGVYNKVRKLPYSVTYDKVCLPFKDKTLIYDLYNFSYDNFVLDKIITSETITNRGQCYFNDYKNKKELFQKFLWKHFITDKKGVIENA